MIDRNQMALHMAATQFAITTLLPSNVNTICTVSVNGEIPTITVSNRRKPTKKEKRICRKLLHLTPVTNGMQWDEWVGYAVSVYGVPIELRWKRLRAGELIKAIERTILDVQAWDSDMEWTGDDDDAFDMLGVM